MLSPTDIRETRARLKRLQRAEPRWSDDGERRLLEYLIDRKREWHFSKASQAALLARAGENEVLSIDQPCDISTAWAAMEDYYTVLLKETNFEPTDNWMTESWLPWMKGSP
jgi:hypothetical protein